MGVDYAEKMQNYIEALEEERRKILVFERELPLCLELVTQGLSENSQIFGAACLALLVLLLLTHYYFLKFW